MKRGGGRGRGEEAVDCHRTGLLESGQGGLNLSSSAGRREEVVGRCLGG